jgi:hypothetical protein
VNGYADAVFNRDDADYQQMGFLEAIRNVIAHNAALADKTFLSRVKRHPQLGALAEGARLPVDGEMINRHRSVVIRFSTGALKMVDTFLTPITAGGNPT